MISWLMPYCFSATPACALANAWISLWIVCARLAPTSGPPVRTFLVPTVSSSQKVFGEQEVRTAKRGQPAWSPPETTADTLPGGWSDLAEARGIPEDQTYRSWRRFKEVSAFPFLLEKWTAWIARERIGVSVNAG
jgi:hypothetical protein